RAVATAAHQHLKRIEQRRTGAKTLLRKTNLLLMGPTGSGKTHIARNLAELLEVPFTVVDATEYTEAGYYGKDVEVMVAELLFKSGHSIDATERGIIFTACRAPSRNSSSTPSSLRASRYSFTSESGGAVSTWYSSSGDSSLSCTCTGRRPSISASIPYSTSSFTRSRL